MVAGAVVADAVVSSAVVVASGASVLIGASVAIGADVVVAPVVEGGIVASVVGAASVVVGVVVGDDVVDVRAALAPSAPEPLVTAVEQPTSATDPNTTRMPISVRRRCSTTTEREANGDVGAWVGTCSMFTASFDLWLPIGDVTHPCGAVTTSHPRTVAPDTVDEGDRRRRSARADHAA